MARVRVVTDSLADIPPEIAGELGITVVPAIVRFGNETYRDKLDLTADQFYRRLTSSPIIPSTSQPPPEAFKQVYERLSEETDAILSLHSVRNLTGIYDSATIASSQVPNVQIRVLDSQQVTMALGWLVITAARAALSGDTIERLESMVRTLIPRSHIVATLDTLEYARRGGRLGKAAAMLGTLLNVKPIISLENGEVVPVQQVRTSNRAVERLAEIVLASGPVQNLAVMHSSGRAQAERLKEIISARLSGVEILMGETGPVLGTHVGPGAIGIAWLNGPA